MHVVIPRLSATYWWAHQPQTPSPCQSPAITVYPLQPDAPRLSRHLNRCMCDGCVRWLCGDLASELHAADGHARKKEQNSASRRALAVHSTTPARIFNCKSPCTTGKIVAPGQRMQHEGVSVTWDDTTLHFWWPRHCSASVQEPPKISCWHCRTRLCESTDSLCAPAAVSMRSSPSVAWLCMLSQWQFAGSVATIVHRFWCGLQPTGHSDSKRNRSITGSACYVLCTISLPAACIVMQGRVQGGDGAHVIS
jgi:hypothetical protein